MPQQIDPVIIYEYILSVLQDLQRRGEMMVDSTIRIWPFLRSACCC